MQIVFACVLTLAFMGVLLMIKVADAAFFDLSRYDNSPLGDIPCMEVQSGSQIKQQFSFVPLKESRLVGSVKGPLANLSLSQKYSFTKEQSAMPLEVLYRFPLPGDAAVKGAVVRFGEVEIKTSLIERKEAKAVYDSAKKEGQQAVFASRESEDIFTLSITGIEPDVEVEVLVEFAAIAWPVDSWWELRFPLTISPRYVRQDEAGTTQTSSNPLARALDPGHRFSMELELKDVTDIASSTHEITTSAKGDVSTVTLTQGIVTPDRDLLLSWKPDLIAGEKPFGGKLYTEEDGDDTYFLLLAAANERGKNAPLPLKREVSLLIDHSGSMEGTKWEAADWAAKKFLSDLGEDDHFSVAFFHNNVYLHSKRMLVASPQNVDKAVEFITENRSSGGTELGTALERMLMIPKITPEKKLARQLLVITDAQVTDKGRILEVARRESESYARRRISVLCIDASPNSTLTNRLAERGGGTTAYLTSAPDAEDVTTAVDEILSRWSRPVAENVVLEIDAKALHVAGKKITKEPDSLKVELGSLMGGEPLWIVGKISGFNAKSPVLVCFDEFSVDIAMTPILSPKNNNNTIRSLFGARQIQELEFLKFSRLTGEELKNELSSLGYEVQGKNGNVYEENERTAAETTLNALLLEESLKYGVVSSYTALVASRKEKGKHVSDTALTPNAFPHGWDKTFFSHSFGDSTGLCSIAPAASSIPAKSHQSWLRGSMQNLLFSADLEDCFEVERSEMMIYNASITLSAGEEFALSEISGARGLFALYLSEESLASLDVENMEGITLRIYSDGGARPSASVKLSDLVKLGGKRPLNISYAQSARFVLVNETGKIVKLKKLSIFVS